MRSRWLPPFVTRAISDRGAFTRPVLAAGNHLARRQTFVIHADPRFAPQEPALADPHFGLLRFASVGDRACHPLISAVPRNRCTEGNTAHHHARHPNQRPIRLCGIPISAYPSFLKVSKQLPGNLLLCELRCLRATTQRIAAATGIIAPESAHRALLETPSAEFQKKCL